ncbi:MAG: dihydrolipoyl dehydrogenase [Acholeplasmatales bacterium]|nr:MAG: dihydrolipoyl dehydrogenase [Acholeplasmatales bacterium]
MKTFDITVIGGGPGGYVAAIKAAQLGKNVALVEKEAIGGVCLNWGCIPTKTLLKSAKVYSQFMHAKQYGLTVDPQHVSVDFKALMKRKSSVVKKLTGGVAFLLKRNGVTVYDGFAEVLDAQTIKVGDETFKTDHLIIATGAHPAMPPIDGLKTQYENGVVLTSKEILDLSEQPKRLVIIGGGVIGVEFATIFNTFGTEVTILEREADILLGVDEEIRAAFKKKLERDGVTILTEAAVIAVTADTVRYQHQGATHEAAADKVLLATGMRPNLKGLEALDLALSPTGIETDATLKTNIPNVYAIGDVNGKHMLAHVASMEGIIAVETILGKGHPMDYDKVPSGIYTFPEIAQVGLTEAQAKARGIDYKVSTFPLSANGKALGEGEKDGLVKLIAETTYNEIIGLHILAPGATEMIAEGVLAMHLEATADDLVRTIHPHPTLSEMIHEVAHGILDKPIHL